MALPLSWQILTSTVLEWLARSGGRARRDENNFACGACTNGSKMDAVSIDLVEKAHHRLTLSMTRPSLDSVANLLDQGRPYVFLP